MILYSILILYSSMQVFPVGSRVRGIVRETPCTRALGFVVFVVCKCYESTRGVFVNAARPRLTNLFY